MSEALSQSRFMRACRRAPVDCTPVWLMRQAGRYMKAYRDLRARHDFLTMAKTPELAAEVTLQPVGRFALDAAIIFSDILLPLEAMGLPLRFVPEGGPVIDAPLRTEADLERLRPVRVEHALGYVMDAIALARGALPASLPLIGFAGAPFTLASYAIEGGSSRTFARTKALMWCAPKLWARLMDRLCELTVDYLSAQVAAGACALQLFDSWAGALAPADYAHSVLPYSQRILAALEPLGVPVIHFALGTSPYLPLVAGAGADVVAVDWHLDLDAAWAQLSAGQAIQGNLDPLALLAPPEVFVPQAERILASARGRTGHIFNLGHGIFKDTPEDHVARLIDAVHAFSATNRQALLS